MASFESSQRTLKSAGMPDGLLRWTRTQVLGHVLCASRDPASVETLRRQAASDARKLESHCSWVAALGPIASLDAVPLLAFASVAPQATAAARDRVLDTARAWNRRLSDAQSQLMSACARADAAAAARAALDRRKADLQSKAVLRAIPISVLAGAVPGCIAGVATNASLGFVVFVGWSVGLIYSNARGAGRDAALVREIDDAESAITTVTNERQNHVERAQRCADELAQLRPQFLALGGTETNWPTSEAEARPATTNVDTARDDAAVSPPQPARTETAVRRFIPVCLVLAIGASVFWAAHNVSNTPDTRPTSQTAPSPSATPTSQRAGAPPARSLEPAPLPPSDQKTAGSPAPPSADPVTAPIAPTTASLVVESNEPHSTVLIDDIPVGETDDAGRATVPSVSTGLHRVVVRKPGFVDGVANAGFSAGMIYTFSASLKPKPGRLSFVLSTPDTAVTVDGFGINAPNIQVSAGTHHVVATKAGYGTATYDVDVQADRETSLTIALTPQPTTMFSGSTWDNPSTATRPASSDVGAGTATSADGAFDAIQMGKTATIVILHDHLSFPRGRSVSRGYLLLTSQTLKLTDSVSEDSFTVPWSDVQSLELIRRSTSSGSQWLSLSMKVALTREKDGKKNTRTYNFYSPDAVVQSSGAIQCARCEQELPRFLSILERVRAAVVAH